jgi:hypothetical protein
MNDHRPYPAANIERFIQDLMTFVGFAETDAATIRGTASVVLEHAPAITAAVYEHFLEFPETARFFVGPDGRPDTERLARRKHSLERWLRQTAQASTGRDFLYSLLAIGLSHSHRTYGPGGRIPPEFMVGAMSVLETALARLFQAQLAEPGAALEASIAWNKLLLIHLNILLLGYVVPWRQSG